MEIVIDDKNKMKAMAEAEKIALMVKQRTVGMPFTLYRLSGLTGKKMEDCEILITNLANFFLVGQRRQGNGTVEYTILLEKEKRIELIKQHGLKQLEEAYKEQNYYKEMIEILTTAMESEKSAAGEKKDEPVTNLETPGTLPTTPQ
jgi:hypothetical protein